jgi:flagellar motility protein MotE (MotC chaperone)
MNYYQRNRARILELARKYRAANRADINRKQRERYATNADYRQYQADYRDEYRKLYGRIGNVKK